MSVVTVLMIADALLIVRPQGARVLR
jgi:hypothetical protein